MADFTLPIINAVDDLRQSNREASERLRSTLSRGLFEVVKSVNRLQGLRTASSPTESAATTIQERGMEQDAHIYDKIQALTSFLTSSRTGKISEMESAQREAEQKMIAAQSELTRKYSTLQGEFIKIYGQTGVAQSEIFQNMLLKFNEMAAGIAKSVDIDVAESERNAKAQHRLIDVNQQLLDVWAGEPDRREEAKRFTFGLMQQQAEDDIRIRQGDLPLGDPELDRLIKDLKEYQAKTILQIAEVNSNAEETNKNTAAVAKTNAADAKESKKQSALFGGFGEQFKNLNKTFKEMKENAEFAEDNGGMGGTLARMLGVGKGIGTAAIGAGKLTWRMLAWAAPYVANPVVAAALLAAAGLMWYNEYSEGENQKAMDNAKKNLPAGAAAALKEKQTSVTGIGGDIGMAMDRNEMVSNMLAKEIQDANPGMGANEAKRLANEQIQSQGLTEADLDPESTLRTLSAGEEDQLARIQRYVDVALAKAEMAFLDKTLQDTGKLTGAQDARYMELEERVKTLSEIPAPSYIAPIKRGEGAEVNGRSAAAAAQKQAPVIIQDTSDKSTVIQNQSTQNITQTPAAAGKVDKPNSSGGGTYGRGIQYIF